MRFPAEPNVRRPPPVPPKLNVDVNGRTNCNTRPRTPCVCHACSTLNFRGAGNMFWSKQTTCWPSRADRSVAIFIPPTDGRRHIFVVCAAACFTDRRHEPRDSRCVCARVCLCLPLSSSARRVRACARMCVCVCPATTVATTIAIAVGMYPFKVSGSRGGTWRRV